MMAAPLTLSAARKLVRELIAISNGIVNRTIDSRRLTARVDEHVERVAVRTADGRAQWRNVKSARIVFTGGTSEHSLEISASDEARVRQHFAGYALSNGCRALVPGTWVRFPSSSAPSGERIGTVVKLGRSRVTIAFKYKYGRESTRSVPLDEVRV